MLSMFLWYGKCNSSTDADILGIRLLMAMMYAGGSAMEKDRSEKDNSKDGLSRRGFIGISSAALATVAGSLAVGGAMAQQGQATNKARIDRSATDPGPSNEGLDSQNQDSAWPPGTDSKSLVPTFKYPFSLANKRVYEGGWSREVTVRELPVSTTMAGVDMRLTAGGVRELHWHTAAEWAYMLYGSARITAIDNDGRSFVADVKESDLWYFPTGIPHSIQGLNPDGAEFLLVFDDGNFSEYATVLLSDWMAHTPKDVLAKSLGVPQKAFDKLTPRELFIFQSEVPGPLEADQKAAAGTRGLSKTDFAFRTLQMPVTNRTKGGEVRVVDSSQFKVSQRIASAIVTVHPGGIRELHWH